MTQEKILVRFLKENRLIINVENKQLEEVRKILKEVNDVFVIEWEEKKPSAKGGYEFVILCPSTSFVNAYYTIGCKLMRKMKSSNIKKQGNQKYQLNILINNLIFFAS